MEESFAGFVIYSEENNKRTIKNYEEQMVILVSELGSNENIKEGIKYYINITGDIVSQRISNTLLSMLEYATQNNLISPK